MFTFMATDALHFRNRDIFCTFAMTFAGQPRFLPKLISHIISWHCNAV